VIVLRLGIVQTILERNSQIVQMRREGVPTKEVARRFKLSRSRIQQIELRAADDEAPADHRATQWAQMRAADDPEKCGPCRT
jgi:hypothetical protein